MKTATSDPFGEQTLGIERGPRAEGTSEFRLQVAEKHMNPHGVVHGGVIYSMADNGMGAALYTLMSESELCATIEIKIVYLSPVRSGELVCNTRVINRGKRVATLESDVLNDGKLVAKALGTYALFPAKS